MAILSINNHICPHTYNDISNYDHIIQIQSLLSKYKYNYFSPNTTTFVQLQQFFLNTITFLSSYNNFCSNTAILFKYNAFSQNMTALFKCNPFVQTEALLTKYHHYFQMQPFANTPFSPKYNVTTLVQIHPLLSKCICNYFCLNAVLTCLVCTTTFSKYNYFCPITCRTIFLRTDPFSSHMAILSKNNHICPNTYNRFQSKYHSFVQINAHFFSKRSHFVQIQLFVQIQSLLPKYCNNTFLLKYNTFLLKYNTFCSNTTIFAQIQPPFPNVTTFCLFILSN